MLRSEIISKLSQRIHPKLKKSDLDKILQIVLDAIVEGIENNKSTELRGFGRFSVKKLKEKISRNPRTGDKVFSPEKISIAFKVSRELKKKINQNRIIN
tara:strand:+ start:383 stop:679 length:297 start_codon:yes stop_codon:yes gene_type:complete